MYTAIHVEDPDSEQSYKHSSAKQAYSLLKISNLKVTNKKCTHYQSLSLFL